ncbi:ribosome maturation factor RimP [Luteipulveratus mongoliensis]|uniref:Ribosome maturation factor RimP n=1 Tax=Luteipulveratus mongoliensis TaxID=571913 RepID=A0A0K1JIC9_9MICO|nr:ribosome maturation factor RimP [Luteipulveratus mongoliensis]AKU16477.1 hypothetical protein VV02_12375 [Luteipulveratus mongoliensis]
MSATARAEQVHGDVASAVEPLGLLVEDVAVTPAGKRRLVRVLVDREVTPLLSGDDTTSPVEPLSLDEVADATRAVSDALDASDVMGDQPYVLEVSSPGTDRPLAEPRHFRRNVGRLVELTPTEGESLTGRITAATDREVTLEVPGPKGRPGTTHTVAYADCAQARVQVEFNRASGATETAPDDEKDS